jgi:signal transduction histidine kinase
VLGELAHELRTPLTFLCGAIDLLEMEAEEAPMGQAPAILAQMRQSLWGMVRLLDNAVLYEELGLVSALKDVATHSQQIELKKFCGKLLNEIVPLERLALVETDWPDEEIFVQVDRELLRTLLGNLIANAVQFSAPDQPIHLSIHQETEGLRLILRDWGVGIPPEAQAQVGTPFFRASNALYRPGLGLGLCLAKACATIMGSQLALVSQAEAGCVATWYMAKSALKVCR